LALKCIAFCVPVWEIQDKARVQQSFNLKPWKLCQFEGSGSLDYGFLSHELDDVRIFPLCVDDTI